MGYIEKYSNFNVRLYKKKDFSSFLIIFEHPLISGTMTDSFEPKIDRMHSVNLRGSISCSFLYHFHRNNECDYKQNGRYNFTYTLMYFKRF